MASRPLRRFSCQVCIAPGIARSPYVERTELRHNSGGRGDLPGCRSGGKEEFSVAHEERFERFVTERRDVSSHLADRVSATFGMREVR